MTKAFDEVTQYLSGNNDEFEHNWAQQLLLDAQNFQRRAEDALSMGSPTPWAQTAANYLTLWGLYRQFEYGDR